MKTPEYLDRTKAKLGLPSDYALAKYLGVSREYISQFRRGKMFLGDEMKLRLAEILEIPPFELFAAVEADRAKSAPVQAVWNSLLEKISTSFEVLISAAKPRRGSFSGV
jgi:transcriptional regulator with XRE-family HTH domain